LIPAGINACAPASSARLLQTGSTFTVNGQTGTITFGGYTNTMPLISSLSKTSASPILKGTLIITGTQFSTLTDTRVFLVKDSERKYELTVVSVTSTSIECILGGGRTADYNVVILDATTGQSSITSDSVFSYQLIVDSISPTSGSLGGGYNITITGRNFGDASSHTVFVG